MSPLSPFGKNFLTPAVPGEGTRDIRSLPSASVIAYTAITCAMSSRSKAAAFLRRSATIFVLDIQTQRICEVVDARIGSEVEPGTAGGDGLGFFSSWVRVTAVTATPVPLYNLRSAATSGAKLFIPT